jgi:hypothetical protein
MVRINRFTIMKRSLAPLLLFQQAIVSSNTEQTGHCQAFIDNDYYILYFSSTIFDACTKNEGEVFSSSILI